MGKVKAVVLVLWLLVATATYAQQVPLLMDVQGFIRTESGEPVNKPVALTVSLYDQPWGGDLLYQETLDNVPVTNGRFAVQLGTNASLSPDLFADHPLVYVGVSVDGSPELPRQSLATVPYSFMSQRAGSAASADVASDVGCQGCVTGVRIADSAVTGSKIKDGSVTADDLASGSVTAGKIGEECASGQVLKRLPGGWGCADDEDTKYSAGTGLVLNNGQFSLDMVTVQDYAREACYDTPEEVSAAGFLSKDDKLDQSQMPLNGLNEISNGLLTNQFFFNIPSPNTPVPIKDNYQQPGTEDVLTIPDIGVAEKLDVCVSLTNSDISSITIKLFDPNNAEHVLYDKGQSGTELSACFPDPTNPVSGDLTTWVGKNPQGKWRLVVIDNGYLNNQTDGNIESWSLKINTLSSQMVQSNGDFIVLGDLIAMKNASVDGTLTVNDNLSAKKDATVAGDLTVNGNLTVAGQGQLHFVPNIAYKVRTDYTELLYDSDSWKSNSLGMQATLDKKRDNTLVRIVYRDIIGTKRDRLCGFEVRMDGQPISSPGPCRSYQIAGYYKDGGFYHDWVSTGLECLATGVPKGQHTFEVYWRGYCYFGYTPPSGWEDNGRWLIVEELY